MNILLWASGTGSGILLLAVSSFCKALANPLAWLLRAMDLIQEWDRPVHWVGRSGDAYMLPCFGTRYNLDAYRIDLANIPEILDTESLLHHDPPFYYENRMEEHRPHSCCMHRFWAQDVETYLNTGSNASDLGRMVDRFAL